MSRIKNIFNGVSFGLINNILNILLPFISRTIIIHQLGIEYVGLKGIFTSVLQVLSLSELGFGASIGYLLYKPLAEKDTAKVNAILTFYRKIYRIIGFVILVISIALVPFLNVLIAGEVPDNINIYILYGIYVINTVISYFFFAYKKILLSANQRYDIEVRINSILLIAQNIIQIIVLIAIKSYYVYVIVIPIMTVLNNYTAYRIVNKRYPEYKCDGLLERSEIKGIIKNTSGAFFSKIGSTVYLSVDNIVISAFLGLKVLGVYDNYYYVISSIVAVFAVIHNALRPVIGNVLAVESKERAWRTFRRINYVYMLLVIFCSTCVYLLVQDFEFLWGGAKNMLGYDIVILLAAYFFVGRLSAVLTVFQEAAGLFWQGKFIPLISAVINLVINIILVQIIGLPGILISSIVSSLFVSLPGYAYIIFKHLFVEKEQKMQFLKDGLLVIVQTGIAVFLGNLITKRIVITGWVSFLLKSAILVLVLLFVLIILNMRNTEAREIALYVKKRFRGKKRKGGETNNVM